MKILSVLMLCTLFACTKPQADNAVANPETPISNPLELSSNDSLQVEASVTAYPDGITNRWKVEVYMSRFVNDRVNVTVEWKGPGGPVLFKGSLEAGEREHRFITDFTTPIDSSPEDVRVTSVLCATPQWVFIY